ncbi:DUF6531 domain-containing protein, partial [Streptomyces beijiangensis]
MSNPIVKALEHGAAKLGKTVGEDAGKAVKDLYHSAGDKLKKVAKDTAETDAKHARELDKILKSGEKDLPHAPREHPGSASDSRTDLDGREKDLGRDPSKKVCENDPVDMATGRVLMSRTDVTLPALLPLIFSRAYESSYRFGGWFGPAWASTADQRLEIGEAGVLYFAENGTVLSYPHPPGPDAAVFPAEGARKPLTGDADTGYTLTDPESGRSWHFGTPGAGGTALLEQITDRSSQWLTFEYDTEGAPAAIVHSAGYHLRIGTEDGRITALHLADPAGDIELVRFGYDGERHLSAVTRSSGLPTVYTNDALGRMAAWTDTNGSTYSYVYDEQDRCTYQTGEAGHLRATYTYDSTDPETGHRITEFTNSLGHTTRYLIDGDLRVVAVKGPDGGIARTTYDDGDRPVAVTDPLGRTTGFAYDDAGRPVMVVGPDGTYTSIGRDENGRAVTIAHPDGALTTQVFDARGNRTEVTDPSGAAMRFVYDERGQISRAVNALGEATGVRCNSAGLPMEFTDPLGAVTRYERDAFGRPTTFTDALGAVTRMEWTVEGRASRRTAPDGSQESWTYDGEGNRTTHTDTMGGVTRYEYGHFDLVTARTGPDGVRHSFAYDTQLRLTQVANPQGMNWDYVYDAAGRLVSETDFDGRTLSYEHDAAGRLLTLVTASGETIRFERDVLGRPVSKDAGGAVTTYAYDASGRLARAEGPDAVLTVRRDRAGRPLSETVNGRTLTYSYDVLGRRTGRVTPAGAASTRTYDASGNCTELVTSGRTVAFAHDLAGRELARHIGQELSLTHDFDAMGRVTGQRLTAADGDSVQARAYAYRADGNLTCVEDQLNGARHFELDTTGRVTGVQAADWTETYAYDQAGNQTSASWPGIASGQEAEVW